MSLVAAGPGRFAVLDQVNGRVTLWSADGKAKTLLKLSGPLAADLAVGHDGSVAVLDRLGNKSVSLFDRDGNPLGVLPLDESFGDAGQMTGVFVDGDDVLVEKAHGPLVRIGSLKGDAHKGEVAEIPGRPSRDGKMLLSAGIVQASMGRLYVSVVDRATGNARFTREVRVAGVVQSIVGLDSDASGTIYLAVAIEQGESMPTVLSCFEPSRGQALGSVTMPTNDSPEESLREMTVLDDGTVVLAHRLDEGMSFERFRCP